LSVDNETDSKVINSTKFVWKLLQNCLFSLGIKKKNALKMSQMDNLNCSSVIIAEINTWNLAYQYWVILI